MRHILLLLPFLLPDLLKEEVKKLYKCGMKDPKDIKQKIKKTYKNRYFLFVQPYSVNFDK
jgi:hypothetical protein